MITGSVARRLVPLAVAVTAATACVPTDADTADPSTPPPSSPAKPSPEASPTTSAKAGAGGLPPKPSPQARRAFLAELQRIDPAIIGDKDPDRIVNRGRDQCSSVRTRPDDEAYLVKTTQLRFTTPEYPDGIGAKKAARILRAVRKYICPGW